MTESRQKDPLRWGPRLGYAGMAAQLAFWMVTSIVAPPGKIETTLVGAFMLLAAGSKGTSIIRDIAATRDELKQLTKGDGSP